MSLYTFRLPDIGEGVAEAEIVVWHVKPGDQIGEDHSLVDVMTDKATVDMTSPVAGVVTAIYGAIGDLVPVGAVLVEIQLAGSEKSAVEPPPVVEDAKVATEAKAETQAAPKSPVSQAKIDIGSADTRETPNPSAVRPDPLAAPATRRRAFELGIALQFVRATGPGGIITPDDLERHLQQEPASAAPAKKTGTTEVKIAGLRRKIAERMQDAKRRIPHFTYVEEFDLTALESLRRQLNDERKADEPKLTLLPFFMRAMVQLRAEFPAINARYDDEAGVLTSHEGVHIGIATQTPGGLMVPVVRHAETLDLWDCARALSRVTTAARDGSASREELSGSTITLTSLGALGGIAATPIINAPEVAIIGPNKLVERPMVINGQIVIRTMMNLSASFDHRIIDGYEAARFVQRLKRLIEQPAMLFLGPL